VVVVLLVIGLVVAGSAALALKYLARGWLDSQKLRDSVAEYVRPPRDPAREPGQKPYLRAKVLVVDRGKHALDPVHDMLPPELKAASKGEVRTVVWLDWEIEAVKEGRVIDRDVGRIPVCKLTLIDWTRGRVVGQESFRGRWDANASWVPGPGPTAVGLDEVKGLQGPGWQVRPDEAILKYLVNLPRQ
jgi:hypothetical protein